LLGEKVSNEVPFRPKLWRPLLFIGTPSWIKATHTCTAILTNIVKKRLFNKKKILENGANEKLVAEEESCEFKCESQRPRNTSDTADPIQQSEGLALIQNLHVVQTKVKGRKSLASVCPNFTTSFYSAHLVEILTGVGVDERLLKVWFLQVQVHYLLLGWLQRQKVSVVYVGLDWLLFGKVEVVVVEDETEGLILKVSFNLSPGLAAGAYAGHQLKPDILEVQRSRLTL
jgi:hypothetical protein